MTTMSHERILTLLLLPLVGLAAMGGAIFGASMSSDTSARDSEEPMASIDISHSLRRLSAELASLREALEVSTSVRTELRARTSEQPVGSRDEPVALATAFEHRAIAQPTDATSAERSLTGKLPHKEK